MFVRSWNVLVYIHFRDLSTSESDDICKVLLLPCIAGVGLLSLLKRKNMAVSTPETDWMSWNNNHTLLYITYFMCYLVYLALHTTEIDCFCILNKKYCYLNIKFILIILLYFQKKLGLFSMEDFNWQNIFFAATSVYYR